MEQYEFGGLPQSKVIAEEKGDCVVVTLHNELSGQLGDQEVTVFGHEVLIENYDGFEPDILSIVPLEGWEVVGENFVSILERASGFVQVCQMLLG